MKTIGRIWLPAAVFVAFLIMLLNRREIYQDFLENGIFDALGYSQNIPNKKASQIASISGCKKMKEYYKLEDTCSCEVIITNNNLEIKDIEEIFS